MNRKLISMCVSIFITAILLCTSLYAWFTSNGTVRASNISSVVDDEFYIIDKDNIKAYYLNYDEENKQYTIREETQEFKLMKFDSNYVDENNNNPRKEEILFVLSVDSNVDTSKPYDFCAKTPNGTYSTDLSNLLVSNVVSFSIVSSEGITMSTDGEGNNNFSGTVEYDEGSVKTFVDTDKFTKSSNIVISQFDLTGMDYIYLVVDINYELLYDLYSKNVGNTALTEQIDFDQDFTLSMNEGVSV